MPQVDSPPQAQPSGSTSHPAPSAASDGDSVGRQQLTLAQRRQMRMSSLSKSNYARNTWDSSYADTYGLEPGRDVDGFYAACRFCISFERVFERDPNAESGTGDEASASATGAARKRRRVVKSNHVVKYRNYRTDSIKRHLMTAHRVQWEQYKSLSALDRSTFFVRRIPVTSSSVLPFVQPVNSAPLSNSTPALPSHFPPPPGDFSAAPATAIPTPFDGIDAGPTESFTTLNTLLDSRSTHVGIIGLGYVGLPLALTFHEAGCRVAGYDNDIAKIHMLHSGRSYMRHVTDALVATAAASDRWSATYGDISDLKHCHVIIICLPTPVGPHNEPDMSYVTRAVLDVKKCLLRPGMLIVLESTTYPGATDTDLVRILEGDSGIVENPAGAGLRCGKEFFVAFSPEREDPGNPNFKTVDIPKLVGGVNPASGSLASLLYRRGGFRRVEEVSSSRVAECAKLLENSYRAVNIALVNELKGVFCNMGVDIWEVLNAAETKPFGYQRFDPGPGIGGHCIPVDPFYLAWKAREAGNACSFITLAAEVNAAQPGLVVTRVQEALNDVRKSVRGSKVLLLGIAYKANVDDIRCAPGLEIWAGLKRLGAEVNYHDPYVPAICATRKHPGLAGEKSVEFTRYAITAACYDVVVVITHHDSFGKYEELVGFAGPIVDTRHRVPLWPGLVLVNA